MTSYLENIDNGLIIEKPETILPWNLQKRNVFDKFPDITMINGNYYTLKIVLSEMPFINCVGLHFEKERLSEIELFNNEKYYSESEINYVFNSHQGILEKLFGKSKKNKLAEKLYGFQEEYRWKFKHATIIHRIWDHFGMEENLLIHVK